MNQSEFQLPEHTNGVVLTFRKTGGDPRLTLTVRPVTVSQTGWQVAWAACWVIFGLLGWRAFRRSASVAIELSWLPVMLFGFGTLAFLSLDGVISVIGLVVAMSSAAWGTALFCRRSQHSL